MNTMRVTEIAALVRQTPYRTVRHTPWDQFAITFWS